MMAEEAAGGAWAGGGLAGDTRVEAVDGPVAIRDLVGRFMPILTRLPSGARGFRILSKIQQSPAPVPLVRLRLEHGESIDLAEDQVIYRAGLATVVARDVRAGDLLEPHFHYPAGYRPRGTPAEVSAERGFRVAAVEPAGEGVVFRGSVKETHCLFLSTGILCAE
jgi:hypothetical protein